MTTNEIKYKIVRFDEVLNIIEVDFKEDGNAIIQLRNPLPRNHVELEKIIKQFAPHLEVMQSIHLVPEFIRELVNKEFVTSRFSLKEFSENLIQSMPAPNMTDEKIKFEEDEMNELALKKIEDDKNKMRETLVELLDEFGILNKK